MVYCKNPQIELSYSHLCSQIPSVTVACGFLYSIKLGNCMCTCIYTRTSVSVCVYSVFIYVSICICMHAHTFRYMC